MENTHGIGKIQDILLAKGRGTDLQEVYRLARRVAYSRKTQGGGGEKLKAGAKAGRDRYNDSHVKLYYAIGR